MSSWSHHLRCNIRFWHILEIGVFKNVVLRLAEKLSKTLTNSIADRICICSLWEPFHEAGAISILSIWENLLKQFGCMFNPKRVWRSSKKKKSIARTSVEALQMVNMCGFAFYHLEKRVHAFWNSRFTSGRDEIFLKKKYNDEIVGLASFGRNWLLHWHWKWHTGK